MMLQIFQLNRYHQKEIFHILLVIEIYLVFGGCCDVWKFIRMHYNYRKHRWAKEAARKRDILRQIQTIYHEIKGVVGYRRMQIYLARNGIDLSAPNVHKYMNTELGLRSIVRRKASRYQGGTQHKTFENLLRQDFTAP